MFLPFHTPKNCTWAIEKWSPQQQQEEEEQRFPLPDLSAAPQKKIPLVCTKDFACRQETLQGYCFTLLTSLECRLKRREFVSLVFNLSGVYGNSMALYFHRPLDTFGLDEENWAGVVSSLTVDAEVFFVCFFV